MTKRNYNGTTLDDLASMVAKGFDGVDKRFNDIESKMATKDELNQVKVELKAEIVEVKHRVAQVDYHVDEIRDMATRLEEGEVLDLQKRVQTLERLNKASKHP